jgi:very-short-patch-repair endonuclease
MPKMTIQHKQKIGQANKGRKRSEESKRKQSKATKGRKQNHKQDCRCCACIAKRGEYNGRKCSEDTKKKISKANKGKKRSKIVKRIMSESRKGKKKAPFTAEHKINMRKNHKGMFGKKHSVETRTKLGDIHKRLESKPPSQKGKQQSKEHKNKIREAHIKKPNKKFQDTSIELKIESELQNRKINYQKQVPLCKIARVDFYLPEHRIVIQCDGCYWHGCPIHNPSWTKSKARDEQQDRVLTFNGFNVYRFWEHDINESPEKCIDKLKM